jgi:methionyl-tRNA synthetase
MNDKKYFYITTTLPYVNDNPHIGFALEIVQADAIARRERLRGSEVFFNFGTDEHGQKIWQKAKEEGQDVKEYVDHYAAKFNDLREALNLSYDAFIRTTDKKHIAAAEEMWKRSLANGDIEKRNYSGLYCVGCEMFVKESELIDGKCPNHPNLTPENVEEENYFFKFSKYQKPLLEYLSKEGVILPEWRRKEAIEFVEGGLEDFSISRLASRMPWGIPVPGDSEHVMYVWFDALTNYISTLGWPNDPDGNYQNFWADGETLQVAGKDQVRFQSLIWQAMLFSAGVPNTKQIIYHGFITSNGQKMSKSLGNVVNPFDLVKEYGTDAVRYFLLRHMHPFEDSDFTNEKFLEIYTANLVNGLGNLVSRVMKMAVSYDVKLTTPEEGMKFNPWGGATKFGEHRIDTFCDDIWAIISDLDEYVQKNEPFKVIKTDPEKAKHDVHYLLHHLYGIALTIEPIMPETSHKIKTSIENHIMPEPLFPRK